MKSHPLRLAQITCDFGSRKPKKWGAIPKSASPFVPQLLLVQRAEFDRLWMEKRMAVQQRRLGEGEARAAGAGPGRGAPANCADVQFGTTAANQATEFLTATMNDITRGAQGEEMGAKAGAAATGKAKDDSRSASQSSEQREDGHDGGDAAAPTMTAGSDSEGEASASARQIGRVAGGERGQTNEGAPGDGAPTSGR